jgi:hypothetical protein
VVDGQLVRTQPRRSKVCLVGYAENSRHMAWWDDPDCEIWAVNQLYRFIPRADRWFQIHHNWRESKYWAEGANLEEWLAACPIPVYMIGREPDVPNSVPYPKAWVKEQLGLHEYFTSTIAFMLGLAIAEGFETVGMYGIDQIIGREYHFEKACTEFFFGIMHGKGIKYCLPETSAVLWQSHTYGYEPGPDYGFWGLDKLSRRAEQLHQAVLACRDHVHNCQGKVEAYKEMQGKTAEGTPSREAMNKLVLEAEQALDKAINTMYQHDGALQEVKRQHAILEVKSRGGRPEE